MAVALALAICSALSGGVRFATGGRNGDAHRFHGMAKRALGRRRRMPSLSGIDKTDFALCRFAVLRVVAPYKNKKERELR